MFIELTETLRCTKEHEGAPHLVVVPDRMDGRRIVAGTIGCPVCRREFPIEDGVACFGAAHPASHESPPPIELLEATLGLTSPGGVGVVMGQDAALSDALAGRHDGVQIVALNARGRAMSRDVSQMSASDCIPLRDGVARGVVVDREHTTQPWLAEAVRVVRGGGRAVVLREDVAVPGMSTLVSEHGVWVGERDRASPEFVPLRYSS